MTIKGTDKLAQAAINYTHAKAYSSVDATMSALKNLVAVAFELAQANIDGYQQEVYAECIKLLADTGMGQPDDANGLRDLVRQLCDELRLLRVMHGGDKLEVASADLDIG